MFIWFSLRQVCSRARPEATTLRSTYQGRWYSCPQWFAILSSEWTTGRSGRIRHKSRICCSHDLQKNLRRWWFTPSLRSLSNEEKTHTLAVTPRTWDCVSYKWKIVRIDFSKRNIFKYLHSLSYVPPAEKYAFIEKTKTSQLNEVRDNVDFQYGATNWWSWMG